MLVVWRRGRSHGHEQRTLSSYPWCLSCLQSIRSSKYSRCKTYSKHWAKAQRSGPSPGKIILLLLLLLLSRFSCVWLCATPKMAAHQPTPFPGILQARTLEWLAISFSSAWKWKVKVKSLSRVQLLATPWTAPYQVSPSMGFSRQEYWSGLPLPSLGK